MSGLKKLKDYLHFNHGERRGLVVLFIILLMLVVANISMPYFVKEKQYNYTSFYEMAQQFESKQAYLKDSIHKASKPKFKERPSGKELSPFPFDPNDLPREKWLKMGLSEKQVSVIKNFEKKGGHFYVATDLSKIYSLSENEYNTLLPFIEIKRDSSEAKPIKKQNSSTAKNLHKISKPFPGDSTGILSNKIKEDVFPLEINGADSVDLQKLYGIGPSYALRIIKYREILGGFFSCDQLLEVYGMDSIRYFGFINQLSLDTSFITQLDINNLTIKELIKHPYIDYSLAKNIVNQREKVGIFTSESNFKTRILLPEKVCRRILPYLKY